MVALIQERGGGWDKDLIRDMFFEVDVVRILSIPLPRHVMDDKLVWVSEEKGQHYVKSYYRELIGEFDNESNSFWKNIWQLKIPHKAMIFFGNWLLMYYLLGSMYIS